MTACPHSQLMLFMWHCCYLFSSQREWLNSFVVSRKKLWSCLVWNLQAQVIIFLRFSQAALWKLHEKVGRLLDKVVLLGLLTHSPLFTVTVIQYAESRLPSPPNLKQTQSNTLPIYLRMSESRLCPRKSQLPRVYIYHGGESRENQMDSFPLIIFLPLAQIWKTAISHSFF